MITTTETIWNDFHQRLFRFIKNQVKDADTANDILQDVFVKIHLKINTLEKYESLTPWLFQIARNSVLDYFRKNKFQQELSDIPEVSDEKTFNEELAKCLVPFVEKLPDNYKEAIIQTDLGSLSQKEFAESKGISYSGAKSRVQRARQQLQSLITECCLVNTDKYGNVLEHTCKQNCGCS